MRHQRQEEEVGIDLAPMLDFVLNLLIFFIITTSFVKEAGVSVDRPEAMTVVVSLSVGATSMSLLTPGSRDTVGYT